MGGSACSAGALTCQGGERASVTSPPIQNYFRFRREGADVGDRRPFEVVRFGQHVAKARECLLDIASKNIRHVSCGPAKPAVLQWTADGRSVLPRGQQACVLIGNPLDRPEDARSRTMSRISWKGSMTTRKSRSRATGQTRSPVSVSYKAGSKVKSTPMVHPVIAASDSASAPCLLQNEAPKRAWPYTRQPLEEPRLPPRSEVSRQAHQLAQKGRRIERRRPRMASPSVPSDGTALAARSSTLPTVNESTKPLPTRVAGAPKCQSQTTVATNSST